MNSRYIHVEVLIIIITREIQIKITMRCHNTPTRMARMWDNGNSHTLLVGERTMVQQLGRRWFLQNYTDTYPLTFHSNTQHCHSVETARAPISSTGKQVVVESYQGTPLRQTTGTRKDSEEQRRHYAARKHYKSVCRASGFPGEAQKREILTDCGNKSEQRCVCLRRRG